MFDRSNLKELFLRNYSMEDALDQLIEKMTVKEIEDLIEEDRALESVELW